MRKGKEKREERSEKKGTVRKERKRERWRNGGTKRERVKKRREKEWEK